MLETLSEGLGLLFEQSSLIVEIVRVNFALKLTGEVMARTKIKERCHLSDQSARSYFPFPPLPSDPLVVHVFKASLKKLFDYLQ